MAVSALPSPPPSIRPPADRLSAARLLLPALPPPYSADGGLSVRGSALSVGKANRLPCSCWFLEGSAAPCLIKKPICSV